MGPSDGGEKGKEVSGDTRAGLRAGNELGTTTTTTAAPLQQATREGDKEEMTDWGGVGWREAESCPFFCKLLNVLKTNWAV